MARRRRGRRGRRAPGGPEREDRERLRASREIGRAFRTVQTIRLLYFITAALVAVLGLFLLVFGFWESAVVCLVAAAFLVWGAGQVRKQPGVWSVAMAGIITLIAGYMILVARWPTTMNIWGGAIALAMWCVVPLAFRVEGLLKEHPDLYITEKWEGRRKSTTSSERAGRIAAETRRQKKAARIKLAVFAGGFVLFAVAITQLPDLLKGEPPPPPPPPEFGTRALDFLHAWNHQGWNALEQFIAPGDRERRGPRIRRLMSKRGWFERRPRLRVPRIEETYSYTKAIYRFEDHTDDIEFAVYWAPGETEWWWAKSTWPKTDLVKR